MLLALWTIALALVTAALAWMSALVVLRLASGRASRRRTALRDNIQTAFIRLLQDDDAAVLLAPHARRGPLVAEVLLQFTNLVGGEDRKKLLTALSSIGVDASFRTYATRGSLAARLACIEALATFPGSATDRVLRATAQSRQPRLRLAALRSLAETSGAVTLGEVLDQLGSGALRPTGRLSELLRRLTSLDPDAARRAAARTDITPQATALLLEALGESGDYGALSVLVERAADPVSDIRAAAVEALRRLGHPAAEPALRQGLTDPDWRVRGAACEAAGDARLVQLASGLAQRLRDPIWRVRFQAASALAKLGPAGRPHLEAATVAREEGARSAATFALGQLDAS